MIKKLVASGDTSGVKDTAAINALLADTSLRTLVLVGQFYVTETITLNGVWLAGVQRTIIQYVGDAQIGYLVVVNGSVRQGGISDVELWGWHKTRGLLMKSCTYRKILSNVLVTRARQVAGDFVNCYGSTIEDLSVLRCHGIGLRTHQCNSSLWLNVQIDAWCMRSDNADVDAAEHLEIVKYACENGKAAAAAHYDGTGGRGTYTEHWPEADDDTVTDSSGTTVVTSVADRAPVVIGGEGSTRRQDSTHFLNLLLENVECADYPSVTICGYNTRFETVRWEGGYHRNSLVLIPERDTALRSGNHTQFRNVFLLTADASTRSPKYFIHVVGNNNYLSIDHVNGGICLTENVALLDGGTHKGVSITNILTWAPNAIAAEDYIALANGAVQTEEVAP